MKFVLCLFVACASLAPSDQGVGHITTNLWKEGKVPYEISKQFTSDNTSLIKEALVEITRTTCIKFIPRFSESDYAVFMEYKNPDQKRGTCWSGKWNNGTSTVGFRNGRHIVSLWPDLDCFNKFGIIRELLNIFGLSAKLPSTPINKGENKERTILYGSINYEEKWTQAVEESASGTSCRKDMSVIKTKPYAMDMKERALAAMGESCNILRNLIDINQLYNCSGNAAEKSNPAGSLNSSYFASVSPNCTAEAEVGTCKSDPVYMTQICEKSFCDGTRNTAATTIPTESITSIFKTRPSNASLAHLRNAYRKCLATDSNCDGNSYSLIQWKCKAEEKGQQWSWNQVTLGSKDRHICNGHGKCAGSPDNNPSRTHLIQWETVDESGQKYHFLDSSSRAGFFIIKNDFGNCLGVDGDGKDNGLDIIVSRCKSSAIGQHWEWYTLKILGQLRSTYKLENGKIHL